MEWTCEACTVFNAAANPVCEVCGAEPPLKKHTSTEPISPVGEPPPYEAVQGEGTFDTETTPPDNQSANILQKNSDHTRPTGDDLRKPTDHNRTNEVVAIHVAPDTYPPPDPQKYPPPNPDPYVSAQPFQPPPAQAAQPTQDVEQDTADANSGLLLCAQMGCLFSWIPIVGCINCCLHVTGGPRRSRIALCSCAVAVVVFLLGGLGTFLW